MLTQTSKGAHVLKWESQSRGEVTAMVAITVTFVSSMVRMEMRLRGLPRSQHPILSAA